MLGINTIISAFSKSTVSLEDVVVIEPGAKVIMNDGQIGTIQKIALSPYYVEEKAGVYRALVWADEGFALDYILIDELELMGVQS